MEKVVSRKKLHENSYREDREYWLSKSPEERFSAIEMLRRQWNGYPGRLQRVVKITNSNEVEYLIAGGYALGFHGVPRYTGDLDLFVAANPDNAESLVKSINDFGFGSLGLKQSDFTEPGNVIQIGNQSIRVVFLTQISGVGWTEAWESRIETTLGGVSVNVVSKEHLIRNKKAIGRPVDLGDLDRLV